MKWLILTHLRPVFRSHRIQSFIYVVNWLTGSYMNENIGHNWINSRLLLDWSYPLREMCPYSEFFWSVFSRIQFECGEIRTRKTPNTDTFHVVISTDRTVRCFIKYLCKYHSWSLLSKNFINGICLQKRELKTINYFHKSSIIDVCSGS